MHASSRAAAAAIIAALAVLAACGSSEASGGPAACLPAACAPAGACGVLEDGCGGTLECPCPEQKSSRCDPPSAEFCSDDGFCWLNPLPQGDDLRGVWGARDDAVWAAGPGGALLLWDGGRWLRVALPDGAHANAIWGTAPDDAWAVGSAVLRWDGACWTDVGAPVPDGGLTQVHGTAADDVWASGPNGLLHFDGISWSAAERPPGPPPSGLLALAPHRVLVGARAGIWTWDGARWTESFLGYDVRDVVQLWGAAPDDVWAAAVIEPERCRGAGCPAAWQALFHFDGAAWSRAGPALPSPTFHAVTGTSASDVWAFSGAEAWHWDGAGWTSRPLPRRPGESSWPTAVRAARLEAGGGWAAGDAGLILRRDGGTWTLAGGFGTVGNFTVATGTGEQDVWLGPTALGTYGGESVDLLHWDGTRLAPVPTGFDGIISTAWAQRPGEVWATTFGAGLLHLEDGAWTARALGTEGTFRDVVGFGPDVYWVEQLWDGAWYNLARLGRWNGSAVTSIDPPPNGWEHVSGTGPSDLWLTGSGCQGCDLHPINDVARFDGAGWSIHTIPGDNVYPKRAWSDGEGSAWIVGYPGLVAHAGPAGVSRLPAFGTGAIEAIVGGGPADLWAFGWHGLALRYDGRTWAPRSSGTRQWLLAAWRSPDGELFVAGSGGAILRRAR
jgi:hypothetical protein